MKIKLDRDRQNTHLNKKQAESFANLSKSVKSLDMDKPDYDTQGLFKELYKKHNGDETKIQAALTPGNEFEHVGTDRYKKSSHPTFSNESKYSNMFRRGGSWTEDSFVANKRNIRNMTNSDGSPQNYMNKAEDYNGDGLSDIKLVFPKSKRQ